MSEEAKTDELEDSKALQGESFLLLICSLVFIFAVLLLLAIGQALDISFIEDVQAPLLALAFLGLLFPVVKTLMVRRSLIKLLWAIDKISEGEYGHRLDHPSKGEVGQMAQALNKLSQRLKQREEQFQRSQEEFRVLFENVPTYVAVVDRNYRIVQANRNFRETFGGRLGDPCFRVYKGLSSKCGQCPVEETFLEGKGQLSEEKGRTKDGREIHYLVYTAPVMDMEGNVIYAIEMSVDLTERRKLERELRASREFLDSLIGNSIHGIVAVDASGKVIVFNRAAEEILGYRAPEAMGSLELERFFPSDFAQGMREVFEGRSDGNRLRAVAEETWVLSKSGQWIPVRFSGVLLREEEAVIGAVGFFQDLRPIKKLEMEKAQVERMAIVGQTVAALAHGIKNIITGLEGGVYVTQTAMKRHDEQLLQKGWEMVGRNLEKISSLVRDLLNYSRVGVGERLKVRVSDVVDEIRQLFEEKARQTAISLAGEVDPSLGEAILDPKAIHTCLANLVSNALDACAEVEGQKGQLQVVLRAYRAEGGELILEVQDNGVGMEQEVRERLFHTFFTTKGTRGTGLGLMVTHKLVHEHGGWIEVESAPGEGSLFRIVIPGVLD